MTSQTAITSTVASTLLIAVLFSGCTGDQTGNTAGASTQKKGAVTAATSTQPAVAPPPTKLADPRVELSSLSPAIPLYAGATYRDDLTRRDSVMVRNQYGPTSRVYTLSTDDSFPQVYHYYTTYLAQFRAYPTQPPYPPEQQNWRTLEVQLNQAMQDPFIPGDTLKQVGPQVTLQISETEAEPKTLIRYIITQQPVAQQASLQP